MRNRYKTKNQQTEINEAEKAAYVEFVDCLFADSKNLFIGVGLQACIIAAFVIDTKLYYAAWFIASVLVSGFWRWRVLVGYHRATNKLSSSDIDQRATLARIWENKYLLPSAFAAANIGIFVFFGLTNSGSLFAVTTATILMFSPLPTIVGRVYGSRRLAVIMLAGQFLPVIGGYLLIGGVTHYFLAILCIPYLFLVLGMVENVREKVIFAVNRNAEKGELGRQLNTALSNMSHGLIMFDENSRILVMNNEAFRLFDMPLSTPARGRSIGVLLRYARRHSAIPVANLDSLERAIFALLSHSNDRRQVRFDDGRYLDLLVSQRAAGGTVMTLEDVTQRVISAKKIERMAQYDGLTGLANRQHFETLVSNYLSGKRSDGYFALLVVDIDDFKYVNDAIGHGQGDELLRSVARKLQPEFKRSHFSCRLGGDEFLVFMGELKSESHATDYISTLSSSLTGVHQLLNEEVYSSCSIGFCVGKNKDFCLETAMLSADLALYSAKKTQKGGWCQFDSSMNEKYHRRQKIKKLLGNAIRREELSLIYQPLVDATTGRLVACEALSRWHTKEFGQISPAEFIPLAEEMGVITKITAQVLHAATRECVKWPEHVSVSVNISQIDFRSGDILAVIDRALEKSGLDASRLEIEITETAVSLNEAEMIEKLHAIHARGVRIALDDFGIGQSSLSYLHRLPLDKVKIDRSFVVGIDTGEMPLALLHCITNICRTLNLDITVEGVETQRQLQLVVGQAHVNRIQGFIYGAGLPASGIDTLARMGQIPLAERSPRAARGGG